MENTVRRDISLKFYCNLIYVPDTSTETGHQTKRDKSNFEGSRIKFSGIVKIWHIKLFNITSNQNKYFISVTSTPNFKLSIYD